MKLIKPKLISGEIMTLLDEADDFVVIVSPYIQIKNWVKFQNTLSTINEREIPIDFYYREGELKTKKELEELRLNFFSVKKLHCKIYMNEKTAIVSSMNLYEYSDNNSLDIAYKTETKKEFKEIYKFYERYIEPHSISTLDKSDFLYELREELNFGLKKYSIKDDDDIITITYNNSKYSIYFEDEKKIEIKAILSRSQYEYILNNDTDGRLKGFLLQKGFGNEYDILTESIEVESSNLDRVLESDLDEIFTRIIYFVRTISEMKNEAYKLSKK